MPRTSQFGRLAAAGGILFSVRAARPTMSTLPSGSPPPSFGDLLRRFRVARGLTQERLAERSGLSVRGISDLERGARTVPYRETIVRLIAGLELAGEEEALL